MKKVDLEIVKRFYNETPEIWAANDYWHLWSRSQIQKYLSKVHFPTDSHILNAGSGGNDYGILCDQMVHVDIAEEKLRGVPNAVIASVENLPFSAGSFDGIVCVGSVINYCDAATVISEFSRVSKSGAVIVLEFESSCGYEYKGTAAYEQSATVVTVKFQGVDHTQWLYSPSYIRALLEKNLFFIENKFPYQICSSLALYVSGSEARSVPFAKFDVVARKLPPIATHANNVIFLCRKL